MNTMLRTAKWAAVCAAIACLAMVITPNASAVSPSELLRVEQNATFQGVCCFSWLEKVSVTEPATIAPVIVTWSTDYQANGAFRAGLSVNGGPCQTFGSREIVPTTSFDIFFDSMSFQWLIQPTEGLVKGKNTFTLCGGAVSSPTATILVGFNTLAVRVTK